MWIVVSFVKKGKESWKSIPGIYFLPLVAQRAFRFYLVGKVDLRVCLSSGELDHGKTFQALERENVEGSIPGL